ncbi:crotonyl-CoA carboxylase/reductase, partial [Streptomyces sp. NPDC032472]
QAAYDVHRNLHQGKVGVLALAPEEGLGVRDHELRARHLDAINRFRAAPAERTDEPSTPEQ